MTQADIISNFKTFAGTRAWEGFSFLFDKDVDISSDKPNVKAIQAIINFGTPLEIDGKRYENRRDNPQEQLEYVAE